MGEADSDTTRPDFFVSYNHKDEQWAEWIAWQLEEAGYTTKIQAWDFVVGSNFVSEMQKATATAERTIAVLSPNYLASDFTESEWAAAFAKDPKGLKRLLIPVRIEQCDLDGLLAQIVYVDFVDVAEEQCKEKLLSAVAPGRAKPDEEPAFPGGASPDVMAPQSKPDSATLKTRALERWRSKLAFMQEQLAVSADPEQKFAIAYRIREAERWVEKLQGEATEDLNARFPRTSTFTFTLEMGEKSFIVRDQDDVQREVEPPWYQLDFRVAYLGFNKLTREPVESDADRQELFQHATTLGTMLCDALFDEDGLRQLDTALQPGAEQRPLLTIQSSDDWLLSLPWELLCRDNVFLVRDGHLDLVRSTPDEVSDDSLLSEPKGHFQLVLNVSAPMGSALNYEGESYRITKALSTQCRLLTCELGTMDDLVETLKRAQTEDQSEPKSGDESALEGEAVTGVHFSGHGAPAKLQFENEYGEKAIVDIDELLDECRKQLEGRLPPFFYLASCHGNTPGNPDEESAGSESSAAELHRQGVTQVVGYYGPILDELSTRAEETLYGAIAAGRTTQYAVRLARNALQKPLDGQHSTQRPNPLSVRASADLDDATRAGLASDLANAEAMTHPFAWAQLVLYHRGPDEPLSLPSQSGNAVGDRGLRREFREAGSDRKVLSSGFIGRRKELHHVRRALRGGRRVFVFQGLGGLGKSTLAFEALKIICPREPEALCTFWCQESEDEADPAEWLVAQLLDYCRNCIGADWEPVVFQVDRVAGEDSAQRFGYYLHTLLQNIPRLVIHLDNLESLLIGPKDVTDEQPGALGKWRSEKLQQIWQMLVQTAGDGDKLDMVASCRYLNDDFEDPFAVPPLSSDALLRLMGWFPALRQLSIPCRVKLLGRLAGHPRGVEYLNDLVHKSLGDWKKRQGPWQLPKKPEQADFDREWEQLIAPVLPDMAGQLKDDLLLAEIWDTVLDEPARKMLYRMTLLRGSWNWDLIQQLGDQDADEAAVAATADALRTTSLLEQVQLKEATEYTVHPATVEFVQTRFDDSDDRIKRETHLRVGTYLEAQAKESRYIQTDIEAGHHLFQAGEYDRSYELLGNSSVWLHQRGARSRRIATAVTV